MSFTSRITLQDDTPADEHFDTVSTTASSTTRRVAARPLDQPKELFISHNAKSDNSKVDTVVSVSRREVDADEITLGDSRVQVTIRYNPGQITETMIQEDAAQVIELLSSANITKLLNREH